MHLHCFVGDKSWKWVDWFPWTEFCYNTTFHTSFGIMPFWVVYGREPPCLLLYELGTTRLEAIDRALQDRDEVLKEVRLCLQQTQLRTKSTYDHHHHELSFEPGQFVWLRLQSYCQRSVNRRHFHKLAPKFYGPFNVLKKVGKVAYELELPADSKIHNVFHISLLKEFKGDAPSVVPTLPALIDGKVVPQPQSILAL